MSTTKSLSLMLQSARDSLGECLGELSTAVEYCDEVEMAGGDPPIPSGELERVWSQCRAAFRQLEQLARKT